MRPSDVIIAPSSTVGRTAGARPSTQAGTPSTGTGTVNAAKNAGRSRSSSAALVSRSCVGCHSTRRAGACASASSQASFARLSASATV